MAHRGSLRRTLVSMFVVTSVAACGGGDGDGGGPPTGPSPVPAGTGATITITDAGLSPETVDISPGQRVEFVNGSSRSHQIFSTPHTLHNDCPPINEVSELAPGQRKQTGVLSAVRICGFHDHMDPTNNAFRGAIRVGTVSGPAPEY